MTILNLECENLEPHKMHIWKKGFLGLRKRRCFGVSLHRHYFKLSHALLTPRSRFSFTVNWECDCSAFWSRNRAEFYTEMLGRKWPQ